MRSVSRFRVLVATAQLPPLRQGGGAPRTDVGAPGPRYRQSQWYRSRRPAVGGVVVRLALRDEVVEPEPPIGAGTTEMVRALRLARQSAIRARVQAANQLHALVVTPPDALRERLRASAVPGAGRFKGAGRDEETS